jgi:hypothetical protein
MSRVDNLKVWRRLASVVEGCADIANAVGSMMHKPLGFLGGVGEVVVAGDSTRVPARLRGGDLLWLLGFLEQRLILQRMRGRGSF